MRAPLGLLVVLLLTTVPAAIASAGEYRRITFPDGRTFVGEVVGTSDASLTLRIAAGDIQIPFVATPEIMPATRADMDAEPPLPIVVLDTRAPADLAARAQQINDTLVMRMSSIPRTRVVGANALGEGQRAALGECGQSIGCMLKALDGTGSYYAVVSVLEHHEDGERLRLISLGIPEQQELSRAELVLLGDLDGYRNRLLAQGYRILGITPRDPIPDDAPVVLATADGSVVDGDGGDGSTDGVDATPGGEELIGSGAGGGEPGDGVEAGGGEAGAGATVRVDDLERRRRVAIALGFVPFPGLGAAHLRNPGGFAVNFVLDVGAGAGLVYLFGAVSPTALGFYVPAIAATYAVGVLINQIVTAASYRRYRTRFAATAAVTARGPRVSPLLVALPDERGGATVRVGITLSRW